MLRLEPILTRFVDDVLRAIRAASLDDLRELLPSVATAAAWSTRAPRPEATTARKPAPSRAPRRSTARPARAAAPQPRAPRAASPRKRASDVTEITDPEKLLGLVLSPMTAPGAAAPHRATALLSDEVPASTERPTAGGKARLRAGETLAREAGNGVVIRRAKRA